MRLLCLRAPSLTVFLCLGKVLRASLPLDLCLCLWERLEGSLENVLCIHLGDLAAASSHTADPGNPSGAVLLSRQKWLTGCHSRSEKLT